MLCELPDPGCEGTAASIALASAMETLLKALWPSVPVDLCRRAVSLTILPAPHYEILMSQCE